MTHSGASPFCNTDSPNGCSSDWVADTAMPVGNRNYASRFSARFLVPQGLFSPVRVKWGSTCPTKSTRKRLAHLDPVTLSTHAWTQAPHFIAVFLLIPKNKIRLMRSPCCVSAYHRYQLLISGKSFPVTGLEGLQSCNTLRIPHCIEIRLTDGGKVFSSTHRQRSTPQKHYFSVFNTHFCWRLSEPPGLVRLEAGRLRVPDPMRWMHFFCLGPGVYLASNRNEYQKQKNNVSVE
jgi:hypothetical protein